MSVGAMLAIGEGQKTGDFEDSLCSLVCAPRVDEFTMVVFHRLNVS
jgi:hypothetical protein